MNLITGRAGAAHITPRQDAMWHQGLIEMESCIFDAYENFAAEIITNNEVRIRSGVGMLQGRFFCIEPNTYDSAEIANGNQGEERIDLIVARIAVDASANTQSASIEVIQGTPAAENPTAPEAVTGDLDAGDLIADYPLAEVHISSINITSVENAFNAGWLSLPQTRQNINFIGRNPIASIEEDTTANWASLGTGMAVYSALEMIADQPSQYGMLVNQAYEDTVFQKWCGTNVNGVWYRRGNQNGWQGTWIRVLDEKTGIQKKLLWSNASPGSSFGSQTISLDLSEYDEIQVEFRNTSSSSYYSLNEFKKGKASRHNTFAKQTTDNVDTIILDRPVTMNENGVYFGGGSQKDLYSKSYSTNNGNLIPVRIWGIKGVQ